MTIQNYLEVDATTNIVVNAVVWDGNTSTWTPPKNTIMLPQETTPAMVWKVNIETTPFSYDLVSTLNAGQIGFSWDGTVLMTNEPNPTLLNTENNALGIIAA